MRISAVLAILALTFGISCAAVLAREDPDPWYRDMGGHWARPAVQALWEEDVSDGYVSAGGRLATFRPDNVIGRGEHAMLVARVFALEPWSGDTSMYPDLDPDLVLYNDKPAFGWVEASARRGMVLGLPDGTFRPLRRLDRGSAVFSLVLSLGLEEFALSLSPAQVDLYLSRFSDAHRIDPDVRHLVGAAVKLRILRGYPDGTLRLGSWLLRGEAASLIHRSCLFRLTAPATPIYPHCYPGDSATVGIHSLRNRNAAAWQVEVADARGLVLWSRSGSGDPPSEVTWDGRDSAGRLAPPGTYFAGGWLTDLEGNVFHAVPVPIYIQTRSLTGYLSPTAGRPGTEVEITCHSTGRPLSVVVIDPETIPLDPLEPASSHSNTWLGSWIADGTGRVEIVIAADFGADTRTLTLPFTVLDNLLLTGWLEPDRGPAGANVIIHARTSPDALWVRADGAHVGAHLESLDGTCWTAAFTVPLAAGAGPHPVTLTAGWDLGTRDLELTYWVEGSLRDRVEFLLTD